MAFAITQNCCNDASCLAVCPVNCIHPTPDEPDFGKTDLLHIDPRACIDCGACADACPVDAIVRVNLLAPDQKVYAKINADYYEGRSAEHPWKPPTFPPTLVNDLPSFSVGIVGTGPAACYAAQALLRLGDTRVTFYEKLRKPGGLARYGVAPDHTGTRRINKHFKLLFIAPRVKTRKRVTVGRDIFHTGLTSKHDVVVYAIGAAADRPLDIPGTRLPGFMSARTVVGWYTGHPDVAKDAVDLHGVDRVVLIGNGNVALDVARILTADLGDLVGTEISKHALKALRGSRVREVVIAARRGPEHAAFTRSECQALVDRASVDVAVTGDNLDALDALPSSAAAAPLADVPRIELGDLPTRPRIVFAFDRPPVAVHGTHHVDSVEFGSADGTVTVPAQRVLLAIGYRGDPVAGLPYDDERGTIRNDGGRVVNPDGTPVDRTYVVGWAKRGATGGIGDNKVDAEDTVHAILEDMVARTARP